MAHVEVIWDLEDDAEGNLCHIADHDVTSEEVEEVLQKTAPAGAGKSRSSGNPIVFGWTSTGKYLAVDYEVVEEDPPAVYPITAYEAPPPRKKGKKR
jgi:hypothetical protein